MISPYAARYLTARYNFICSALHIYRNTERIEQETKNVREKFIRVFILAGICCFIKKYFICKTLNQNTLRQLFKMFMTRMEENSRKHYKSGPTTSSSKGLFFNLTTQTLYDIFPRDEKHKSKHFLVPFHSAGWKISMTKVFLNSSDASLYEESSMKLVTRGEWRDSELFISFVSMIRLRHT